MKLRLGFYVATGMKLKPEDNRVSLGVKYRTDEFYVSVVKTFLKDKSL